MVTPETVQKGGEKGWSAVSKKKGCRLEEMLRTIQSDTIDPTAGVELFRRYSD